MPRRATPPLPPERRAALRAELRQFDEMERRIAVLAAQAAMDKYVHIARCLAAGMTLREIAADLAVSYDTVSRWRDAGEAERSRLSGKEKPDE